MTVHYELSWRAPNDRLYNIEIRFVEPENPLRRKWLRRME